MPLTVDEQLAKVFEEYTDELGDKLHEEFTEIGEETSQELKDYSKATFHHKAKKHYANGWTYKVSGQKLDSMVKIYNKTKPGLTHLLENGHMILIRGKNYGRSKVFKHIEPAEKKATQELLERLKNDI